MINTAHPRRRDIDQRKRHKEATLSPGGTIVVALEDDAREMTLRDLRTENARLIEQLRAELGSQQQQR